LKIGPFLFKVEASPIVRRQETRDSQIREALRVQAAAVAAQQIALDEDEARLHERRQKLQQQEEQLAGHLAEKQRQIQLWSDYTKAERESLRKQKVEHEQLVARTEQEMAQAKQTLEADQKKVAAEKTRIDNVYQRLRQRWHKQWGGEKEK